jgi:hypothetical protein
LPTLTLLAYASPRKNPSIISGQLNQFPDLIDELKSACDNFVQYAKRANMGVRRDNVLKLLVPVGIPENQIDIPWLQKIDEFGQKRGSTAHSPKGRVNQPIDPKSEFDTVSEIIKGVRVIDQSLEQMSYRLL